MKNLVISTGAGMSAESGITTFRDAGGLWENYKVMDVASDEGFARNPALIHKFYNERRLQLIDAQPNAAHRGLVELEKYFNVNVITQNVDDLHERAGSKNVLHLHGELMKVRSMTHPERIYTLPCDQLSDKGLETSVDTVDAYGDHVRPHIVFSARLCPTLSRLAALPRRLMCLWSSAPRWWCIPQRHCSSMRLQEPRSITSTPSLPQCHRMCM